MNRQINGVISNDHRLAKESPREKNRQDKKKRLVIHGGHEI
ncbi:MAG: hypothetical protein WCL00_06215 [Bacteroidota bacterium]